MTVGKEGVGVEGTHFFSSQIGKAEVLRGLWNFLNRDSLEHHSSDRLEERGVEKVNWPTFHTPRLGLICIQLDQRRHCFYGNFGRTAEKCC